MTEAECRAEIRKFFMELYPACTVIYSYPGNAARPPAPYVALDFNAADSSQIDEYDVFSCKSGEKQVGSISSDYAQTGSFDLNDKATWSWHYIRKLGAEAMMYEKFNGSGSTYVRAAFHSPGSAGVYAPWRGGGLYGGASCGLPCANGRVGPGAANWSGVPRLAGSGKKRG